MAHGVEIEATVLKDVMTLMFLFRWLNSWRYLTCTVSGGTLNPTHSLTSMKIATHANMLNKTKETQHRTIANQQNTK